MWVVGILGFLLYVTMVAFDSIPFDFFPKILDDSIQFGIFFGW